MVIYTLSLHDALPISSPNAEFRSSRLSRLKQRTTTSSDSWQEESKSSEISNLRLDRKSTRLNSSHRCISYAVLCLKKKIVPQPFTRWGSCGRNVGRLL